MKIPRSIKRIISKNSFVANKLKISYDNILEFFSENDSPNKLIKSRLNFLEGLIPLSKQENVSKIELMNGRVLLSLKDGTNFFICDGGSTSSFLLYGGLYETEETSLVGNKIKPGWNVIDAGANFGWYSVHFSKWVGENGNVFSFEPIPQTYKELQENIDLNKCTNIQGLNRALGNREGNIEFFLPKTFRGRGLASEYNYYGERVNIEMTTIDSFVFVNKINHLEFIKADIEGGELNLIRGGIETIRRFHPDFLLEIEEWHTDRFGYHPREIFSFFKGLGYNAFAIIDKKFLKIDQFDMFPKTKTDAFYFSYKEL